MKELLETLEKGNRKVKGNIFRSLSNSNWTIRS